MVKLNSLSNKENVPMHNQSDMELMRLIRQRQREALEELYDRYVKLVYSFALRSMGTEATAREVVQLVFTRLWTTGASYDSQKGTFVSWLLTITRNITIDLLRQERRQIDAVYLSTEHWVQLPDTSYLTPEDEIIKKSESERIRAAFRYLSDAQRNLVELLYWQGYTLSEIAETSEQPLGTIKSRLYETLRILRQHLLINAKEE
jgi:RNA polymerase sigma factor (sigma-70 family)